MSRPHSPDGHSGPRVSQFVAGLLDVVLVVVFAAIGRASHDESSAVAGVLFVAWPFLVGLAAGWAVVRWRSHRWPVDLGAGVVVWVATVVVGMLLRAATGRGTALAFVVVASLFLGLVLLGWRVVVPRLVALRR